jgi:drug/metabolite transporter (DMT)-like permease
MFQLRGNRLVWLLLLTFLCWIAFGIGEGNYQMLYLMERKLPWTLTLSQLIVSTLLGFAVHRFVLSDRRRGSLDSDENNDKDNSSDVAIPSVQKMSLSRALYEYGGVAALHCLVLALTNIALLSVDLHYVEVLNTAEPIIVTLGSWKLVGRDMIGALLLIMAGILVVSTREVSVSGSGVLLAALAILCASVRTIALKSAMKRLRAVRRREFTNAEEEDDDSIVDSALLSSDLYITVNALAALLCVPLWIVCELPDVVIDGARPFDAMTLVGVCSFVANQCSYVVLAYATTITYSVATCCKRITVVYSHLFAHGRMPSLLHIVGTALALVGIVIYSRAAFFRRFTTTAAKVDGSGSETSSGAGDAEASISSPLFKRAQSRRRLRHIAGDKSMGARLDDGGDDEFLSPTINVQSVFTGIIVFVLCATVLVPLVGSIKHQHHDGTEFAIQAAATTEADVGGLLTKRAKCVRKLPLSVLYVGWLGRDNLGDELMMRVARRMLTARLGALDWHAPPPERLDNGDALLRQQWFDLFVLGGGSLLESAHLKRFFALVDAATTTSTTTPVLVMGAGYDNYRKGLTRERLADLVEAPAARRAQHYLFGRAQRELGGIETVRRLAAVHVVGGVRGPLTRALIDVAIDSQSSDPPSRLEALGDIGILAPLWLASRSVEAKLAGVGAEQSEPLRHAIGLLRRWRRQATPPAAIVAVNWGDAGSIAGDRPDEVEQRLADALRTLVVDDDVALLLYSMWPGDMRRLRSLHDAIVGDSDALRRRVHLCDDPFGLVSHLMDALRLVDASIALKLHANIVSLAVETPTLMLQYRLKGHDFFEHMFGGNSTGTVGALASAMSTADVADASVLLARLRAMLAARADDNAMALFARHVAAYRTTVQRSYDQVLAPLSDRFCLNTKS